MNNWKIYAVQVFGNDGKPITFISLIEAPSIGAAIEVHLATHGVLSYNLAIVRQCIGEFEAHETRDKVLKLYPNILDIYPQLDSAHIFYQTEDPIVVKKTKFFPIPEDLRTRKLEIDGQEYRDYVAKTNFGKESLEILGDEQYQDWLIEVQMARQNGVCISEYKSGITKSGEKFLWIIEREETLDYVVDSECETIEDALNICRELDIPVRKIKGVQ